MNERRKYNLYHVRTASLCRYLPYTSGCDSLFIVAPLKFQTVKEALVEFRIVVDFGFLFIQDGYACVTFEIHEYIILLLLTKKFIFNF